MPTGKDIDYCVKEHPLDSHQQYLDCLCFPTLFPTGRYGFFVNITNNQLLYNIVNITYPLTTESLGGLNQYLEMKIKISFQMEI